jgi:hypothetical protein
LPEIESTLPEEIKSSLVYIAGYVVKKESCSREDSHMYFEKYGTFTTGLNRGGLTIPNDSVCQWTFFCFIIFGNVCNQVCRTSLTNIFLLVSDMYDLNMREKHAMTLSNIFLNNFCKQYARPSEKEPKQKVLKLSH